MSDMTNVKESVATTSSRQLKIGAVMSYSAIIFNIVAGLIYTPWMIRQIGQADYGLFTLIGAFLSYFVMDFGLGNAIARFISKYRAEGRDEAIGELLGLTTKLYLAIDLCILVLLVVLYFFIGNIFIKLTPLEIEKLKVLFCIAGFFSVVSFPFLSLNSILIAYEQFFVLKLCDLLNKVLTICLMVMALLAGYQLYALIVVNVLVGLAIIIVKLVYLRKKFPLKISLSYFDLDLLRQLFAFSAWITVVGIAQRLLINITPTILGIFSGSDQIAVFAIGSTIEGYTWMFASALGGLFLPRVSRLVSADNRVEVGRLMIRVGRIQLFVVGLIIIGFVTLGRQFISLWLGEDFRQSYFVVLFLILPGFVTLTQEIAYTLLNVENRVKSWALLFLLASILSVLLSVLLSPRFGAIGSAVGIFTALMLCHVIGMNVIFSRILKLDILTFFRECHLKMFLPLCLAMLGGFLINAYIPASSLTTFIPKALLLAALYLLLMWTMGLNAEEKNMISSFVHKKTRTETSP